MKRANNFWNDENIRLFSSKFAKLADFKKEYPGAYKAALKLGISRDLGFKPMNQMWDKIMVLKIASNYEDLKTFRHEEINAYQFAVKNKFTNELNLKRSIVPSSYWTNERIREEASKYNSISEFAKFSDKAYRVALQKKMINSLFEHKTKQNGFWNEENIRKYAKGFKTIKEFDSKYTSAVQAARKLDILYDLGLEKIGSIHKRCIYAIEFENKSVYIGLTCNLNRRKFDHEEAHSSKIGKYIKDNPKLNYEIKQLTEYVEKDKACVLEQEYLDKYVSNGYQKLNSAKPGGLGSTLNAKSKISDSDLLNLVSKYETLSDLLDSNDKFAYRLLSKRKLLKQVSFKKYKKKVKWTHEYVLKIINNYESLNDFRKNNELAWKHAKRLNMIKTEVKYLLTNKPEWL